VGAHLNVSPNQRAMFKIVAFLLLTGLAAIAKEPTKAIRSAGDYQVTITLSDANPISISSISVKHGKQVIELPATLFSDITSPHIGGSYKASEFVVEAKRSKLFIRLTAGDGKIPDDHALILTLPLKSASRITRSGDFTGYTETRSATPITN